MRRLSLLKMFLFRRPLGQIQDLLSQAGRCHATRIGRLEICGEMRRREMRRPTFRSRLVGFRWGALRVEGVLTPLE